MKYGMSAGTSGKDEGVTDSNGIVPGHAYTILAAKTITNKDGNKENLVKLRNPWKKGEWKGRYSDQSSEWYPALRQELDWNDKNDGIFWMTYDDMIKSYDAVEICKIDDENVFSHKHLEDMKGYNVLKLSFSEDSYDGHLTTFGVSQKDYRSE